MNWRKHNNHFIHTRYAARIYYLRRSGYWAVFVCDLEGTWQRQKWRYNNRYTLATAKIQVKRKIARGEVLTNGRERSLE